MSKYRQAPRTDANQPEIVKELRMIPGVMILTGHDDILVGYRGLNFLIEIKDPAKTLRQDGRIMSDTFKPEQIRLLREWPGQYDIAWTIEDALRIIGV